MDEDIKATISKTAQYVRDKGISFEAQLLADSEKKFGFIKPDHQYHDYYKSLVSEDRTEQSVSNARNKPIDVVHDKKHVERPPESIFSQYERFGSVSSVDLEIVKQTAEYCVLLRKSSDKSIKLVLEEVMLYFQDAEELQFLNKKHELFPLFQNFLTQYEQAFDYKVDQNRPQALYLQECFERASFKEYEINLEGQQSSIFERYKLYFAAVNWDKFHVIENLNALMNTTTTPEKNEKRESQDSQDIKYKIPLDFSKLSQKSITNSETQKYLKNFFTVNNASRKENDDTNIINESDIGQNKPRHKGKKRKGKILVKSSGETRLNKKRK